MISPFMGLIKWSGHHSVLISVAGESSLTTCLMLIFNLSLTKLASQNSVTTGRSIQTTWLSKWVTPYLP